MTDSAPSLQADQFEKLYPSVEAADAAFQRSLSARRSGVPTPAVQGRNGPMRLSFDRVVASAPPTLAQMVKALQTLHRMPPDRLTRFDPFLRIRPRLGGAPLHIQAFVRDLEAQDAALHWPATAVIHGDFHPGQTIQDRSGTVWLLDLDDLALGPTEADLGNLSAWIATRSEGSLETQARNAMTEVLALAPQANPVLTRHFQKVALARRALKLAGKGQPWALDQLPLWA
jgi:hypothetical protein